MNIYGPLAREAVIDSGGIVRVTRNENVSVRPAVETHLTFAVNKVVGVGPFAALALGNNVVEAVGGGVLLSFTAADKAFNIGVGYWVNPHGRVLREDFVPDAPAPEGVTEVAYVSQGIGALAILLAVPIPW